jgi:hypothetical protein
MTDLAMGIALPPPRGVALADLSPLVEAADTAETAEAAETTVAAAEAAWADTDSMLFRELVISTCFGG